MQVKTDYEYFKYICVTMYFLRLKAEFLPDIRRFTTKNNNYYYYLLWVFGVVNLVTVAKFVEAIKRTAHVCAVLRYKVVVRVTVGVATNTRHLARERRRYLDDRRPYSVAFHHETEVGTEPHIHAVVAYLEAVVRHIREHVFAVDLRSRNSKHGHSNRSACGESETSRYPKLAVIVSTTLKHVSVDRITPEASARNPGVTSGSMPKSIIT